MYIILGAICGIGVIIFGVLAGFQKDEIDDVEKKTQNNKADAILESAKKSEFNTDCIRFFEEHKEFERFDHHFLKGFIVIRQDSDNTQCRKTYGDKHYTDFSEFKIYKKENNYFLHHNYEFAQNLFGKNEAFYNVKTDDNNIDINLLNTPQRIWGFAIELPDGKKDVNALVMIKNTEPYVFAFGLTYSNKTISVRK